MDVAQIIAALSDGGAGKATVTIPEGANIFNIDRILSDALVIQPGALINATGTAKFGRASISPTPTSFIRMTAWGTWSGK